MLERMRSILREHDMCVLATSRDDRPHCSLMAYVADDSGKRIHMAMHKTSRKYRNLRANPSVSMMVDTRCSQDPSSRDKILALTIYGTVNHSGESDTSSEVATRLLHRHPHLERLMSHPDAEVVSVEINAFLLLDGVTEARYEVDR